MVPILLIGADQPLFTKKSLFFFLPTLSQTLLITHRIPEGHQQVEQLANDSFMIHQLTSLKHNS